MKTQYISLIVLFGASLAQGAYAQNTSQSVKKNNELFSSIRSGRPASEEGLRVQRLTDQENARWKLHPELDPLFAPTHARDAGNFKEAERLYKLIKPGGLQFVDAQFSLAQICDWQGRYLQAMQAYKSILPTEKGSSSLGSDPRTYYGYASVTARSGDWRQAVKLYEFGLQKYLDTMGDSNMKTIVHFDPEAVETDHLVAWTDFLRGRGYSYGTNYESEEKLRHLKRAVKLKPNFVAAQECLGENMLGYPETAREGKIHYTWAAKYADTQAERERLLQKAGLLVSVGETNVTSVNRKVTVTERPYFIRKRDRELEAILNKP